MKLLWQRNFGLLWWGGLISFIGDWMLRIALPAYVYELTGSTLATGAMFIVGTLPHIVFSSVAGVFVDRWNRQRTLVVANVLLALALLPLLLVRSTEWLWLVYVVALATALIGQFVGPAENSLLPTLVNGEQLLSANSLNALNNNLARLIGPALGGLIAGTLGLAGVALIDTGTYLIAAVMIALIRIGSRAESADHGTREPVSLLAVWRDWLAGLQLARQTRTVRILFMIAACMAVGEGVMAVLFVPFVTGVLGGEALELGWLMSVQAIGGLLGGFVLSHFGQRVTPGHLLAPSAVLFGLVDLAIFNYSRVFDGIAIALVLFIIVGLPAAGVGASMTTLLQTAVTEQYRGRIFGAFSTTFALLTLGGMLFASATGNLLGIVPVISVQGGVYVLAGLVALLLRRHAAHAAPQEAPASS